MISYVLPDPAECAEGSPVFFALALRYARRFGAVYAPAGVPVGAAFGWRLPVDKSALAGVQEDNLPFYRNLGMEIAAEGTAPESGMPYWIFKRG